MAAIPCRDYITDPVPLAPRRINCTYRTCLENRFVAFCFSMDLSPFQRDDIGEGVGAWSVLDIPASHAAQIDDDRGEDLICVSIRDRVYWLDHDRYIDEWDWNAFAPIYKRVRIGPLPSNQEATKTGGFDMTTVKRFRAFEWSLSDGATGAPGAFWDVSVADWNRDTETERTARRRTTHRMRTQLAVKGRAFMVTLEHSANERIHITDWSAAWDVVGQRVRESGKA